MTYSLWLSFLAVALAATFSPGPGVLLAISTTMALGPRRTAYSSAGNAVGVFLVSCVAVSGVGLLFQRSPLAFTLLKAGGACYLAWLGVKQWRQAGAKEPAPAPAPAAREGAPAQPARREREPTPKPEDGRYAVFARGLAVACSNPKSIVFFAAIFPQFMPIGTFSVARFLVLSLTFVACTFVSHFSYVLLAAHAGPAMLAGEGMRRFQRCMGALFVALAAAMLLYA
ncbi:LysE family translocator [Pseudoduganella namucuonensis]|uniref:Threonine/homoserine/homoserine lactone efflux protein n=1 Tax=Pseudoduganella namucuonensis TaxID=1035707 RepID=A0A1I7IKG0_9BURK|nr:LysE family translocator [Pseudoduganella namucuonensis]SFU73421.1 Threonine/homoserine/homoserine lactone efflux protein [Pseudoduganella namucuonensis]